MTFVRKYMPFRLVKADGDSDGDARVIEGYASTFEPPERHDSYGDIIAPGAFLDAIKAHDAGEYRVKLFLRHQIGIGTILEMREDAKGLWIKARVSETRDGDEALTLARDGVLDSMSIGFSVDSPSDWEELDVMTAWGVPVRKYRRIRLKENSLVEIPANEYARVTEVRARRLEDYKSRLSVEGGRARQKMDAPADADDGAAPSTEDAPAQKGEALGALLSKLIGELAAAFEIEPDEVIAQIADDTGLDESALQAIVDGDLVDVSMDQLALIADALGEPLDELVAAAEADGMTFAEDEPPEDGDGEDETTDDEMEEEGDESADALAFLISLRDHLNEMLDTPSI